MKKKPDKIMSMLLEIAQNIKECGNAFSKLNISSESELKVFSEKMKDYEKKGDSILHEIYVELNQAFITPMDHEDIMMLAEKMDDVVDEMEEVAIYFDMYGLTETDEYISEFRKNIGACTEELYIAVELLVAKKLKKIKEHIINVKTNEEKCDMTERKAIRELFKKHTDSIKIIQYKDLYEMLEKTADACQNAATVLDVITMKNM